MEHNMPLLDLPLASLQPDPHQPRTAIPEAELRQLADSIAAKGQLLPIRVRKADGKPDHFHIISGHRRHAVLQLLGRPTAKCIVIDGSPTDAEILEEQLIENLQRTDLSPLDEASGYQRYIELKHCTAADAAKALAVSPARVSRMLALLRLPEDIHAALRTDSLSADTAYHLSKLPAGPERDRLIAQAIQGELSRDQAMRAKPTRTKPTDSPNQPRPLGRVTFELPEQTQPTGDPGRERPKLTVTGGLDSVETLITHLESLLRAARKARSSGWDVSTLAKVLKDQSSAACTPKGGAQ
jgi:ParB family chromosome partitioning protein